MLKLLPVILLLSSLTHADVYNPYYNPPYDYSIKTKDASTSAFDGYEQGLRIASQRESAKQQRELHQAKVAQLKRAEEYRDELKNLYTNKGGLSDESYQKLLILYPEFSESTLKLKESLDKLKSE
ncbi:hypothetical protein [Acinetobacter sp. ESBL14]|uniref:hypothetical protein n=1 Tax=Acinetobacter sp. ESBL14 TaxID=3077329 RepID=UPI002FC8CE83